MSRWQFILQSAVLFVAAGTALGAGIALAAYREQTGAEVYDLGEAAEACPNLTIHLASYGIPPIDMAALRASQVKMSD